MTSEKVATEIHYDAEGHPKTGYRIGPADTRLQFFKLLLDDRQELPMDSRPYLEQQLRNAGKTVGEVTTDFLAAIRGHAMAEITKRYGANMVSTTPFEYVLTVPAVWSDAAKNATEQAATKAGIGPNLSLVSEPEAAIVHALQTEAIPKDRMNVGDNWIVVDAGGGTIDVTVHEVAQLMPLRLTESVPGIGALSGGAFIDMGFRNLVKDRMGSDRFEQLCRDKPRFWPAALADFRSNVKPSFDSAGPGDAFASEDDTIHYVTFSGAETQPEAGIRNGFFELSNDELAELFRPVVITLVDLVIKAKRALEREDKTANGVVLAGGLGKANHVYKVLTTAFAEAGAPPPYSSDSLFVPKAASFEVIQPKDAWTAVVQGAVWTGRCGELVSSRKARRAFGTRYYTTYNSGKHALANKYLDPNEESYKADNQLDFFIKSGDTVISSKIILFDYDLTVNEVGDNANTTIALYCCDGEQLPTEFVDIDDSEAYVVCTLDVDLGMVSKHSWRKHRNSTGKLYYTLNYQLGMQVGAGGLTFDLRVGNKIYGSLRADFK